MFRPSQLAKVALSSNFQQAVLRVLVGTLLLLSGSAAGIAGVPTFKTDESRSPFGTEEECQGKLKEGFANSQRRIQPGPLSQGSLAGPHLSAHAHRLHHASPFHVYEGHRLANGLLAPLTC